MRAVATLLAVIAAAGASLAVADDALDARLKALETQLRCLVCQNQTLAESNAPLAEDLRKEVRELAVGGKSNDEIKQYLVARYGDFVLYRPPVKPTTYLLWFGPFLLLAGGAATWFVVLRRRARMRPSGDGGANDAATDAASALSRARALLDE
ncbi:MAG TPA: cytochrome c-type biogenesis protein [Casimicrobiaceae bacterium]